MLFSMTGSANKAGSRVGMPSAGSIGMSFGGWTTGVPSAGLLDRDS